MAETHTYELLSGSDRAKASINDIQSDIDKLVKKLLIQLQNLMQKELSQMLRFILIPPANHIVWGFLILKTLLFVKFCPR